MSNEENIPCMVKITLYGIGNLIYGNLHTIGAKLYSKCGVAHFMCKKPCPVGGRKDGWMDGRM